MEAAVGELVPWAGVDLCEWLAWCGVGDVGREGGATFERRRDYSEAVMKLGM